MSTNYPNYDIEPLSDFYELYQRMVKFDAESIVFVNKGKEISYSIFLSDIRKIMTSFQLKRKYVLVNCSDKYNFIVSYFAIVLSDNVACLQAYSDDIAVCYKGFDFEYVANDQFVETALNNKECNVNQVNKDNICTVLCSSGTTATPKAVALSQNNIISNLVAGMQKYYFDMNGRYINILPYSHAFGIVCDLLGPLYSCSTVYFAYSVAEFFAYLPTFNPTALNITPAIVAVLAKQLSVSENKNKVVGNSLRKIMSGGAGTPATVCEVMKKHDIIVCGCYGLSECSPCVSINRENYNKFGSAGVSLDCNEIIIKETGEISICGSNVMKGYLDQQGNCIPTTNNTFDTGDVGYIDSDGFLYVTGRLDDMIVFSNGNKIMPTVIENIINSFDGVQESVVYKKNDELLCNVTVQNEDVVQVLKNSIYNTDFCGYRIMQVICSLEPLAKNALGKLDRKKYS